MSKPHAPLIVMVVLVSPGAFAALGGCGRSTLLEDGLPASSSSSSTLPEASTPTPDGGILNEDASPPPTTAPTNTGVLIFVNNGGGFGANAYSSFYAEFDLGMREAGCETRQTGACVYQTCLDTATGIPGLPAGPPGRTISAGTLTLAGGELGGAVVTPIAGGFYGYGGAGIYSNPPPQGPLTFFTPGDTLTVSASGGVVPAFTAAPVAVPQSGTLVTPQPKSGGNYGFYAVSTSEDLAVQWSGGEPGAQFLLQGGGGVNNTSFLCTWEATLGQGVVPQSLLRPFKGVGLNGQLVWYQQRLATFTVGSFAIQESVLQYGPLSQAAFY